MECEEAWLVRGILDLTRVTLQQLQAEHNILRAWVRLEQVTHEPWVPAKKNSWQG
jgi:hypothetical protein